MHSFSITIDSFGSNAFYLLRLKGRETISDLYEFSLIVRSKIYVEELKDLTNKSCSIRVSMLDAHQEEIQTRYFCGITTYASQTQTQFSQNQDLLYYYELTIRPKLWLLTLSTNYEAFQKKTTQEIILSILNTYNITNITNNISQCGNKIRNYCVQYAQSPYDFIKNLMEEEGIFFYFQHQEHFEQLILCDSNEGFKKSQKIIDYKQFYVNDTPLMNDLSTLKKEFELNTNKIISQSFDWKKPQANLYVHTPSSNIIGTKYIYPGNYETINHGEKKIDAHLLGYEWKEKLIKGSSTCIHLGAGSDFSIAHYLIDDLNSHYITYEIFHDIQSEVSLDTKTLTPSSMIYQNNFTAFESKKNYKMIPSFTKPKIEGLQTAIISGPKGSTVYSDELGRVKIHFPWDLKSKKDENSSHWVRVSNSWAGNNWGIGVVPRVGMEVIISYINGDPDYPLIVGCVNNTDHLPPYPLNTNPYYTTLKTQTIEGPGGNELRLSDEKNKEEIYAFAQRDLNILVNDSFSQIIKNGNQSITLEKGNKNEILFGNDSLHNLYILKGNAQIVIDQGNWSLDLKNGNVFLQIKGNISIECENDIEITSKGNININSEKTTVIKGKNGVILESENKIELNSQDKIHQSGTNIALESGQSIAINSHTIYVNATQTLKMHAGLLAELKSDVTAIIKGSMTITG